MSILIFILFIYFVISLLLAVIRFIFDVWKYPVFCKVLKKNIKMFKQYQKQYKTLLKDVKKEKENVEKLLKRYENNNAVQCQKEVGESNEAN